jgi:hypothetical protein
VDEAEAVMNLHMHPRQLVMADGGVSGHVVGAQPLALAAAHLCSIYSGLLREIKAGED